MWCDTQFTRFSDKLRLNLDRQGRIDSALSAFKQFCQSDDQLRAGMSHEPFLQGSVATKTVIRPLGTDEFDVDVIYPFSISRFGANRPTPNKIVQWFIGRLKGNDFYARNMTPKPRCVRLNYAGDFHVDIIPSATDLPDVLPYAVPARDLGGWIKNDPVGFASWVKKIDDKGGSPDTDGDGRFVRAVRIMKRWRDHMFSADSAMSSMLLVTVLGKHEPTGSYNPPLNDPLYSRYPHDAAYIFDMIRLTKSCLDGPTPGAFNNPTVPEEDLARGWDSKYLRTFLSRLDACIVHLARGINAKTETESTTEYQRAFGDSFPST